MFAPICVVIDCEFDVGEDPVPVSAQEVGSEEREGATEGNAAQAPFCAGEMFIIIRTAC